MDSHLFLSHPQKTVKGSKGGPGSAVSPYPTFNPSSDVEALHKAITVKGNYISPKQSPLDFSEWPFEWLLGNRYVQWKEPISFLKIKRFLCQQRYISFLSI